MSVQYDNSVKHLGRYPVRSPLMPLIRYVLRANRTFVKTLTGFFYILGCVMVALYGMSALAIEPIQFKPEIPSWSAQALLWFSIVAVWAFAIDLAEQVVVYILEKVRERRDKNALR